jgi:hypothetical protein
MKLLFALLLVTNVAFASPIDGEMTYKTPSGELVDRVVTIEVPSRGQGEVILSGQKFEWKTKAFKSFVVNGETIFIAAFKTQFRNFKSTILFKGTYLKGSNKIIYAGNFYKKTGHKRLENLESMSGFDYSGSFRFDYLR